MNLYSKMHKEFFLAAAYLRRDYGIELLCFEYLQSGNWLTEEEIEDFTLAYMQGGEL